MFPFSTWFSHVLCEEENKVVINLPPWMVDSLQVAPVFTTNYKYETVVHNDTIGFNAVGLGGGALDLLEVS